MDYLYNKDQNVIINKQTNKKDQSIEQTYDMNSTKLNFSEIKYIDVLYLSKDELWNDSSKRANNELEQS